MKYLLLKLEDMTGSAESILTTTMTTKSAMVAHTYNPSNEEAGQGGPCGSLARQPSLLMR